MTTKLVGHVYDGANLSGEALVNGVFAEITANGVKKEIEYIQSVLYAASDKAWHPSASVACWTRWAY